MDTNYTVTIPDTKQLYTSKNSSHLVNRLPKLHRQIDFKAIEAKYGRKGVVIDYGCGRETSHIARYINSKGWSYLCYDPYWTDQSYSLDVIKAMAYGSKGRNEPVVVLCSNVLNVIDSLRIIADIKQFCYDLATDSLFFQSIYEGDKSNVGRMTKKDCWQRNEIVEKYLYSCNERFKYNIISHYANIIYIKPAEKA